MQQWKASRRRRGGRGRWGRWAIFLLIVGWAVWDGARKRPTLAAEGVGLEGATTRPAIANKPLRVGIFNIAGGTGADGKRDLDRTAATIKGCDLVGLNEVHAAMPWRKGNQAELLGTKLNMPWLFAPTERRWWQDDFGNGLLSSVPVTHWQRLPISTAKAKSHRNALLVRLAYRGKTVNVLITHLDRHDDHAIELRAVTELFLSLGEPAILMGDLNASKTEGEIVRLQRTPGVTDVTGLAPVEHRDSDWIFSRGFGKVHAELKDNGASDHPFYWADLDFE